MEAEGVTVNALREHETIVGFAPGDTSRKNGDMQLREVIAALGIFGLLTSVAWFKTRLSRNKRDND